MAAQDQEACRINRKNFCLRQQSLARTIGKYSSSAARNAKLTFSTLQFSFISNQNIVSIINYLLTSQAIIHRAEGQSGY